MTARNGFYVPGGAGESLSTSARSGRRRGYLAGFAGTTLSLPNVWKNEGYDSPSDSWEAWLSVSEPSMTPPSGNALSLLQHVEVVP